MYIFVFMTLDEWQRLKKLSDAKTAERFSASVEAVWKWRRGQRMPRRSQLVRIYVETSGLVTPNDFVDLPAIEVEGAAAE